MSFISDLNNLDTSHLIWETLLGKRKRVSEEKLTIVKKSSTEKVVIELIKGNLATTERRIPDSKPIKAIPTTSDLLAINLRMKQLEAKSIVLDPYLNDPSYKIYQSDLLFEKECIDNEYDLLFSTKVAHVKKVYPENPVYAMAIPQTIKKGTRFYCAGSLSKMSNLLINQGFYWDEKRPATAYSGEYIDLPDSEKGQWGVNLLGEKGFYFTAHIPAYLCTAFPYSLECIISEDFEGISIPEVTELYNPESVKGPLFSEQEIDKGFSQLQKNYPFLQSGGLHPHETEVVFLKTEGKLTPLKLITGTTDEPIPYIDIQDYVNSCGVQSIHQSWAA